jgi:uncharacterized protein
VKLPTKRAFVRALVTGASSGIGEAIARELARRGTELVLVARSEDRLAELAAELQTDHGVEVELLPADLTDPVALATVEERLGDERAPIDLLVNNAGVGQVGRFEDLEVDGAEQQIALNVLAPVRLTHAALPQLHRSAGGILNVSSLGANQPVPLMATYAATKAFLTSWGEALHEELRGTPVHVTTLAPGFTRTNFVVEADADVSASRVPSVVWADPASVARAGLDGVAWGRALVTPGTLSRLGATASAVTPPAVTRRVMGTVMRRLA